MSSFFRSSDMPSGITMMHELLHGRTNEQPMPAFPVEHSRMVMPFFSAPRARPARMFSRCDPSGCRTTEILTFTRIWPSRRRRRESDSTARAACGRWRRRCSCGTCGWRSIALARCTPSGFGPKYGPGCRRVPHGQLRAADAVEAIQGIGHGASGWHQADFANTFCAGRARRIV